MRWDYIPLDSESDFESVSRAYSKRLDTATPRVYLVSRTRIIPVGLVCRLTEWLIEGCDSRVGLSLLHLAHLPREALEQMVAAGLTLLEVTVPVFEPEPFDRLAGCEGAWQATFDKLHEIRRRYSGEVDCGGGRNASVLQLEMRIALQPQATAEPDAMVDFLAAALPLVHQAHLELWPSRTKGGRVVLPQWADTTRLLGHILEQEGRRWAEGRASIGLSADSGLPLCLVADRPHLLPFFRTREKAGAPAGDGVPERCRGCTLLARCAPATSGALAEDRLAGWRSHLTPFSLAPEELLEWAGAGRELFGGRKRVRHAPKARKVSLGDFGRESADASLWGTVGPRTVTVEETDMPGPQPGAEEFPVLLVRMPGYSDMERRDGTILPPLSLIQLSSALSERGFPVDVLDLAAEATAGGLMGGHTDVPEERLLEFCAQRIARADQRVRGFALIGYSVESHQTAPLAAKLCETVPGGGFNVVGGRGEEDGEGLLSSFPSVDFVVEGEGEMPLVALACALLEKREPRGIPGLCYRLGGDVVTAPSAEHNLNVATASNLDWVNFPLYTETKFPFAGERVVPYMFVHGCPYHCAFCGDYTGGQMRTRNPEMVVEELAHIKTKYEVSNFLFLNTLINPVPGYLEAFLDAMGNREPRVRWVDSAKPTRLDRPVLKAMKEAGCVALTWGIDCASPRLARLMNKGIDLEEASDILVAANEVGITNIVNLIQGIPHETDDDIEATVRWLDRMQPHATHINLMRFQVMENSLLYLYPERFNLTRTEDGKGVNELDGLKWEDKVNQIRRSWHRVIRVAGDLGYRFVTGSDCEASSGPSYSARQ